jgi:hypothetical protein
MNEEWRAVVGYEGIYEVSSIGRVKRIKRAAFGREPAILKPSPRGPRDYIRAFLCPGDGTVKTMYVHRLVAAAFLGPCPDGYDVNHIDGSRGNNHAENLEYVTRSGNMRHAQSLGRCALLGEKNTSSKLKEDQVLFILANRGKITQEKLAEMFGVNRATVAVIHLGKKWKHLQKSVG